MSLRSEGIQQAVAEFVARSGWAMPLETLTGAVSRKQPFSLAGWQCDFGQFDASRAGNPVAFAIDFRELLYNFRIN
jgi:hypothetical protein